LLLQWIFGPQFAHPFPVKEDIGVRASSDESFGFLPWITILLTALVVLIACLVATR
jgi:hypothetical protein